MHSTAGYRSWFSPKMGNSSAVGADQGRIMSIPQKELYMSSFVIAFGMHLRSMSVFTPAQTNRAKAGNQPEFDLTELNKAGVKTP